MLFGTYKLSSLAYLRERWPDRLAEIERMLGEPDERGMVHPDVHSPEWLELNGRPPLPRVQPALPSLLSKAVSLTKAVASRVAHGRAELPIFQQRASQCHGDGETSPCPPRGFSGVSGIGHHYCTECGCGEEKKISQSGSTPGVPILIPADTDYDSAPYLKLMYPYVECPRRRQGFSNAAAPNTAPELTISILLLSVAFTRTLNG